MLVDTLRRILLVAFIMLPLLGFVSRSRCVPASSAELAPDRSISAVSLNIAKESDPRKVLTAIHNAPRLRDADLFLL